MKKLLAVLILSLSLIGCGGSGGEESSPPSDINGWNVSIAWKHNMEFDKYCLMDMSDPDLACYEEEVYVGFSGQPLDFYTVTEVYHHNSPQPNDGMYDWVIFDAVQIIDDVETLVTVSNSYLITDDGSAPYMFQSFEETDTIKVEWLFSGGHENGFALSYFEYDIIDGKSQDYPYQTMWDCKANGDIFTCEAFVSESGTGEVIERLFTTVERDQIEKYYQPNKDGFLKDNAKLIWIEFFSASIN